MSAEVKADVELEIAHILFIDTVGYSKLLINEQRELLDTLNHVVRGSETFHAAEAAGTLIRLPTGDGMALVFAHDQEAPLKCAIEISRSARTLPDLPLRMGIHSGPVSRVVDVNDRINLAGAGINTAQRVMNCGDAGHILLSKRAADDLTPYRHWHSYLHEIGECEVKHGLILSLVNLYKDEIGNPEVPAACRKSLRAQVRSKSRRRMAIWLAAAGLILFFAVGGWLLRQSSKRDAAQSLARKAIAVLPFENLSDDKQNSYLADGVLEEVLNNLAKVADLKVISRTSVMEYKAGPKRNLREIAQQLGVGFILEGSVQRAGEQIRVNAQLIDAKSDAHLWGDRFDRDITDVFALESDIAEQIVSQLRVRLSSHEKSAIEEPPTTNLTAHQLYVRAKDLSSTGIFARFKANLDEAVGLLDEAVRLDPKFFLAYCELADAHDELYLIGLDHSESRLKLARAAVDKAVQLRPEAGETHLVLANHAYCAYFDFDRAMNELAVARRLLPNEPRVFALAGYIDRRRSRWEESTRSLLEALELDPRNPDILQNLALSYSYLRRTSDESAMLDRALAVSPGDLGLRTQRAYSAFEERGDPKPVREFIEAEIAKNPSAATTVINYYLLIALCQHDVNAADRALKAVSPEGNYYGGFWFPRSWTEAMVARLHGDDGAAQAAFAKAHEEVAKVIREQPGYSQAQSVLGMIDAALGRKDDAIREGRRAVELLPLTKNSLDGALAIEYLSVTYAWVGDKAAACEQLALAVKTPGDLDYGTLRLHPFWDSLHGDPRFEKIVASFGPL